MNLIPARASLVPASRGADATSGLYFYGYRFYDPVTGRWPSRDPIREGGGVNLYGFVTNDAIKHLDYLGFTKIPRLKYEKERTVENDKGVQEREKLQFGFTVEKTGECQLTVYVPIKLVIPVSGHGDRFDNLDRDKQRALKKIDGDEAEGMNAKEKAIARMKQHFEKYNKEIDQAWNNRVIIKCEKCDCPNGFTISVEMRYTPEGTNNWEVALLDVDERFSDQYIWNSNLNNVAAHEIGHFLGNFDEKDDPNSDSIMANENGKAHERHFEMVAKFIGRQLKTDCKAEVIKQE